MKRKFTIEGPIVSIVIDRFVLLIIAGGVLWLISKIIDSKGDGWDLAAFLLVLQSIIGVIRGAQSQHSIDKSVDRLAESQPRAAPASEFPDPGAFPDASGGDLSQFDSYQSFGAEAPSPTEAADAVADAASEKRDEIKRKV